MYTKHRPIVSIKVVFLLFILLFESIEVVKIFCRFWLPLPVVYAGDHAYDLGSEEIFYVVGIIILIKPHNSKTIISNMPILINLLFILSIDLLLIFPSVNILLIDDYFQMLEHGVEDK